MSAHHLPIACVALLGATQSLPANANPGGTGRTCTFAVTNVTVVSVSHGRSWRHQTIIFENGIPSVIAEAGTVALPPDALKIDGAGKKVTDRRLPGCTPPALSPDEHAKAKS
jgi:hypothetical protein